MLPLLTFAALLCVVFVPLVLMALVAMEAPDSTGGGGWDEECDKSDPSDAAARREIEAGRDGK